MSTIKVTNLRGRNGSPTLPDGAVVTGVATATTFDGSLKSTGTPTLGLGVTINSSGVNVSGVLTATTYYGDGSNLAGIGETIAPWHYNPDVSDPLANVDTGIGITFNKKILAGSGTATIKLVNAVSGAAGTTVQSWGISSATYNVTQFTLGSLVSNLDNEKTYQVDIPSGFIVDSNETSYAGTAYTFATSGTVPAFFVTGGNGQGQLGQNSTINYSSPVQVPGTTWAMVKQSSAKGGQVAMATKTDGTLWIWGKNDFGQLGLNSGNNAHKSSPTQVGSATDWSTAAHTLSGAYLSSGGIKTDGTLWMWGNNSSGELGLGSAGSPTRVSSPTQVPGTTWRNFSFEGKVTLATKTDNTLWAWGQGGWGALGNPSIGETQRSSPIQIPGTTWKSTSVGKNGQCAAVKTDGTLWVWGNGHQGNLGLSQPTNTDQSSPCQIPGTTWANVVCGSYWSKVAVKTDGTLWTWGYNYNGQLGQNTNTPVGNVSSPVQIPGTTWSTDLGDSNAGNASYMWIKTDGTLWAWGDDGNGQLGLNTRNVHRSSPVQLPGSWLTVGSVGEENYALLQNDVTP